MSETEFTVYFRKIPETPIPGKPLGRNVRHDSRSLSFLVPEVLTVGQTKRWDRVSELLDQGSVGSCTGNAATGCCGTSPVFETLIDFFNKGLILDEDTALRFYAAATALDSYDGTFTYPPPGGDDSGSDGLSVAKAVKNAGLISGYLHITSISAAYTAITQGPFIVGSDWYAGFDDTDDTGVVHIAGDVRGGHEYECIGYDAATDLWEFVNSWGPTYGVDGHFFYSSATFKKLLAADGDATHFVPITQLPPTPIPPVPDPIVYHVDPADRELWTLGRVWSTQSHWFKSNRQMATALRTWAQRKGLS